MALTNEKYQYPSNYYIWQTTCADIRISLVRPLDEIGFNVSCINAQRGWDVLLMLCTCVVFKAVWLNQQYCQMLMVAMLTYSIFWMP